MMGDPPRDGTKFWAIIENNYGRRWPQPVLISWYKVPKDHPCKSYWGDGLDGWTGGGFDMGLWRGDAHIAEWWPAAPVAKYRWIE